MVHKNQIPHNGENEAVQKERLNGRTGLLTRPLGVVSTIFGTGGDSCPTEGELFGQPPAFTPSGKLRAPLFCVLCVRGRSTFGKAFILKFVN